MSRSGTDAALSADSVVRYREFIMPAIRIIPAAIVALSCLSGEPALGWGRDGHRLAGLVAQPLLCRRAAAEIARLSGGEPLARIGLWADEIRRRPEWAHSAPWHYVNIPDSGSPREPPPGAEGNVLTAVERFAGVLTADTAETEDRADALRFLVHFVADVHQPLHVGRAEDRGGNLIGVSYADTETNLHAFWDTDAIRLSGRSIEQYAETIAARARELARRDRGSNVRDWAEQAFALRARVYDFDTTTGSLDADYLEMAAGLAEEQLVRAAAHLANALNDAFCR